MVREVWDEYWNKGESVSFFNKAVSFYRKVVIATQVCIYVDQYFPKRGIFLEMGSGTSETSVKIPTQNRILGAVDFSFYVLLKAKNISKMDYYIQMDILELSLKEESIDGIWNVGVMEHFTPDELIQILKEFYRVLRTGSYCILFWPWVLAPSHLIFNSYERIFRKMGIYKRMFPEAPSMFKKREFVEEILRKVGFGEVKFYPPFFDLTHWVVVGHKL